MVQRSTRGTYKLKILPPGMSEIQDSGKFLEIWAKQADGTWKATVLVPGEIVDTFR